MFYGFGSRCGYFDFNELEKNRKLIEGFIETNVLSDFVFLNTCNRAELYSSNKPADGIWRNSRNALKHLFRVSCGIDSLVVGESEILSQIENSHSRALQEKHCFNNLSAYFNAAILLGKKARTDTLIAEGNSSISEIAIDFVEKELDGSAAIIGSGMLAGKIAKILSRKGIEITILSTKCPERAEKLALEFDCVCRPFSDLKNVSSNVVFCTANCPVPIVSVEKILLNKKHLFVDLGVPPNVCSGIGLLKNSKVINLNDFKKIFEKNHKMKENEIRKVEALIESELEKFEF